MYNKDIYSAFCAKLDRNYADFVSEWLITEPSVLIQQAKEIAATTTIYEEMTSESYCEEYIKPLLCFENPLEVVRDAWIARLEFSGEPDMSCVFSDVVNDQYIGRKYALDDTLTEPE